MLPRKLILHALGRGKDGELTCSTSTSSKPASDHDTERTSKKDSKKHKTKANKGKSAKSKKLQRDESKSSDDHLSSLLGYVSKPKQLHKALFTTLTKKEVKRLVPPALKGIAVAEIKRRCLQKLKTLNEEDIEKMIKTDPEESETKNRTSDLQITPAQSDDIEIVYEGKAVTENNPTAAEKLTDLEIVELELRARAIKALMKKAHGVSDGEQE